MIDSVFRTGKNYYPQVFLEECKYVVKENKMYEYITHDIYFFSDSNRGDFDEEIFTEKKSDEENFNKESFKDTHVNDAKSEKKNIYFFCI